LRSKALEAEGFGTLMQTFKAEEYRNKRLRLSAMVKVESIENWAGLWMRVDGPPRQVLSFDNMQSRPIQGSSDWQPYEIVLDVPEESLDIAFGLLLNGRVLIARHVLAPQSVIFVMVKSGGISLLLLSRCRYTPV
jgi:hypothetical protein